MSKRGKLGLGGLDDFEPKQSERRDTAAADQAGAAHGFKSREPAQKERPTRRRGKSAFNAQINIRGREEDIELFQTIADERGIAYGRLFQEICSKLKSNDSNS